MTDEQKFMFEAAEFLKKRGFAEDKHGGFLLVAWRAEKPTIDEKGRGVLPLNGGAILEGNENNLAASLDTLFKNRPEILEALMKLQEAQAIHLKPYSGRGAN